MLILWQKHLSHFIKNNHEVIKQSQTEIDKIGNIDDAGLMSRILFREYFEWGNRIVGRNIDEKYQKEASGFLDFLYNITSRGYDDNTHRLLNTMYDNNAIKYINSTGKTSEIKNYTLSIEPEVIMIKGIGKRVVVLTDPTSKMDTYKVCAKMSEDFVAHCGSGVCEVIKGLTGGKMLCSCNECIAYGVKLVEAFIQNTAE